MSKQLMKENEIEKIYKQILKRVEKNVIKHNGTTLMSELNKIGKWYLLPRKSFKKFFIFFHIKCRFSRCAIKFS